MNKLIRLVAEHIVAKYKLELAKTELELAASCYYNRENFKYEHDNKARYEEARLAYMVAAAAEGAAVKQIEDALCEDL